MHVCAEWVPTECLQTLNVCDDWFANGGYEVIGRSEVSSLRHQQSLTTVIMKSYWILTRLSGTGGWYVFILVVIFSANRAVLLVSKSQIAVRIFPCRNPKAALYDYFFNWCLFPTDFRTEFQFHGSICLDTASFLTDATRRRSSPTRLVHLELQ